MKKNKNGFTLIELLAVIIILGILMIIAIPSVTGYISNSRKSAYVDTAKQITSGTKNLVNSGKMEMYDTDTTYYINSRCVKTENASKSPYGEFEKAYVLVIYDGKGYDYYWTSVDETGQGVKNIVKIDDLDEDDIVTDIKSDEINEDTVIGKRKKIKVIDGNCNIIDGVASKKVSSNGGERLNLDESCTVNPEIILTSDIKDIVTEGDIIHLTTQLIGFDRCHDLIYQWQLNGPITNYEWHPVSDYTIDWITGYSINGLTFVANRDSIKYSWRISVDVND